MKLKEAWPAPCVRGDGDRLRALRPHDRLADHGPGGLTLGELLSVVAGGARRHRVEAACRALLAGEGLERVARWGVREWARRLDGPARIVTVFCDSGGRYLSTIFSDDWMRSHGFLE